MSADKLAYGTLKKCMSFCLAEAWEGVGMEECGGDMQEMRLGKWKRVFKMSFGFI